MLPSNILKNWDGCKFILSVWRPEAFTARSQGKPKMAVNILGRNDAC